MSTPGVSQAFGRKWKLKIYQGGTTAQSGLRKDSSQQQSSNTTFQSLGESAPTLTTFLDSDSINESTRVKFDIAKFGFRAFWYGDFQIYNLDNKAESNIIKEGMQVVFEAGYANGVNYGTLFDGLVFQPTWTRENVTDFVLGLHCITGWKAFTHNFVSFAQGPFAKQVDLVARIAKESRKEITVDPATLKANFNEKRLTRTKVVHGQPSTYLDNIAQDNDMQHWLQDSSENLVMGFLGAGGGDTIIYTPISGIIGTPVQTAGNTVGAIDGAPIVTQGGITFRVLLDSRLNVTYPATRVQIVNTNIRQMLKQIGQVPTILDQDGIYVIGGVRHVGDTRGTEWYTEVTGFTLTFLEEIAASQTGQTE